MKLLANMNLDSLASVKVYLFIVPKLPKYTFLLQSCTLPLQNVFWSPKGFLPHTSVISTREGAGEFRFTAADF